MQEQGKIRGGLGARRLLRACLAGLLCFGGAAAAAHAQVAPVGEKTMGENSSDSLPTILKDVQVTQRLNAQLPLAATFTDEAGRPVTLGKYFDGKHPAILALVYYNCPMLCSEQMDGLTSALEMVHLDPGKDFQVIVISFDASETPGLAYRNKELYLKRYGRPETANGWHFLTGPQSSINAVTHAIGFGYTRVPGPDGRMTQFAHASSIEIATPEGRIAQYYLGVEYSPKDLLLGLIEASGHQIGSPVANILTYCYHYDPQINRHSLIVARVVQAGGMLTVICLASFLFVMFRRDLRMSQQPLPHYSNSRRIG